MKVEEQLLIPGWFRGRKVGNFRADMLIENKILLELKNARGLEPGHEAQLLPSLKFTEIEIGLLLNFGRRQQFRRLLFDNARKQIRGYLCEFVAGVAS